MNKMRHHPSVAHVLCCAAILGTCLLACRKRPTQAPPVQRRVGDKPQMYLVPVYIGFLAGVVLTLMVYYLNADPLFTLAVVEVIFILALIPWAIAGFSRRFRGWKWPVTAPLGAVIIVGAWLTTFSQKTTGLPPDFNWGPLSAGLSILTFAGSIAVALEFHLSAGRRDGYQRDSQP